MKPLPLAARWLALSALVASSVRSEAGEDAPAPTPGVRAAVLDEADDPVPNAEIVAAEPDEDGRFVLDEKATVLANGGSDGRILSLPKPPTPTSRFVVRAPGRAAVLLPATTEFVLLRSLAAKPVEGAVRFPGGNPVAGLVVEAKPSEGGDLGFRTSTDAEGKFAFAATTTLRYALRAHRAGGAAQSLGDTSGGAPRAVFKFVAGATVIAEIRDPDAAREDRSATRGLEVHLRRRWVSLADEAHWRDDLRTLTGEGGSLQFRDVQSGVYQALVWDQRWAWDGPVPRVEATGSGDRRAGTWWVRRRGAIAGVIVDADEKPVPRARVVTRRPPADAPRGDGYGAGQDVVTDGAGAFRSGALVAADGWWLEVSADGYAPLRTGPFSVRSGKDTDAGKIKLERGWALDVTVRDVEGRPVSDVALVVMPASRPESAREDPAFAVRARSDERGRAALFGLPAEDALLVAEKEGYVRAETVVPRDVGRDHLGVDVSLAPSSTIRVRVERRDGLPLGDDFYVLLDTSRFAGLRWSPGSGKQIEPGVFEVRGLPPGRVGVSVFERRHGPSLGLGPVLARMEDVLPVPGQEVVLVVPLLASMSGVVHGISPEGNAAVVGVEMPRRAGLLEPDGWRNATWTEVERRGREGTFRIDGLPPGSYRLRVTQGSRVTGAVPVLLDSGGLQGIELTLPAGGRIDGRVADGQSRRAGLGAHVWLERLDGGAEEQHAIGDDDGRFTFDDVSPGVWRVAAVDRDTAPAALVVRMSEGQRLDVGTLTLGLGGTIEGTIRDGVRRPLRGVTIRAERLPWPSDLWRTAVSDEAGRFRADRLAPGRYNLTVGTGVQADAEVVEGQTTTVELGAGGDAILSGTVRRRGTPMPGIELEAVVADSSGCDRVVRSTTADAFGKFRFESLPPGRYSLRTLEGGVILARPILVRDGDRIDRDVELGEGRIAGSVRRVGGEAVRDAEVTAVPNVARADDSVGRARTGADGKFQIVGLAVGTYRVEIVPPGRASRVVDGVFADTGLAGRTVDVVLGVGGTLELRVADDGKRGVGSAEVWVEDRAGNALHPRAYVTSPTGRVRIEGLPEGEARVRVYARGYGMPRTLPVKLRDGGVSSADIVVRPAASLAVRVLAGRDAVPRARIELLRAPDGEAVMVRRTIRVLDPEPLGWSTARTGVVVLEDLEEGDYVLRVTAGAAYEEARVPVRVRRGPTTEARVGLKPRGR